MEMTNRIWFAILAVCCGVIGVIELPPKPKVRNALVQRRTPEDSIRAALRGRIVDLHESALVIARRDTMLTAARANSVRTAPLTVITAALSSREDSVLRNAVSAQLRAIGPAARSLVLGVVADTITGLPTLATHRSERQFVLPTATDGSNCLTIVRIGRRRRDLDAEAEQGLFGVCGYYAAFGKPGRAVEDWLRKREYDVAFNAMWPATPEPNASFVAMRPTTMEADMKRWFDFERSSRMLQITACSSGDEASCAKSMREPQPEPPRILSGHVINERLEWNEDASLGPYSHSFLADLHATHGRANFAKFWTSSAPDLETAFSGAFGESTGKWTMRWMRYRYGPDNRGPFITPGAVVSSVLTMLGFIALCASVAYRREAV